MFFFFFSSRRRHTRYWRDWSSDVCSSDLRILSRGLNAVDPPLYGIAPVEAANRALEKAGIAWTDLELVELNEAFAGQALACLSEWKELDGDRLNVNGGAVALGHPIGCSGARIVATLVHELRRRG